MKKLYLMGLMLRNFKGVKEYGFETNGSNVQVFGDNATGKTTLFDAFNWLLFDKDSQDKKDFQLKTVNASGQELHGLEHEVSAELLVDGESVTLRKVFEEKWTKTRGSADKTFSGHTTKYYVNDVPAKKKEYEEKIKAIVDEDIFKLLTSPAYFNESLHWNKRRELLLEIAGDTSDEEVIASNKSLSHLTDIITKRSIEDHKKMIAAKRSEINKELDRLPIRIDEVQRSMPDTTGLKQEEINAAIEHLQSQVTEKEAELSRIQSGNEVSVLMGEISVKKGELAEARQVYREAQFGELNQVRDEINKHADVVRGIEQDLYKLRSEASRREDKIASITEDLGRLRKQWLKVNEESFDEHQQTCPTCKQELPEEEKEAAKSEFNIHKSEKLGEIDAKGKRLKGEKDGFESEIGDFKERISKMEALMEDEKAKGKEIKAKYDSLNNQSAKPFEETEEHEQIQSQIDNLQSRISTLRDDVDESTRHVKADISTLRLDIQAEKSKLSLFEQKEKSEARIAVLEQEERDLAYEFEQIEKELFLIEEFTRSKVNLLEEKINAKFKYATFKLFEEQINGGLKETCETLYGGVPYSKGLNNAAKINVGLDIIQTLSMHYGVSAPIFIDNSEAVTKLYEINAQLISLVVSEQDKALRIEKGEMNDVKTA